jgi:glycosyltransferase involved in cell wall biosynthesis
VNEVSRPLRIALLSFEYPPTTGFGGIGSYTWHQARGLAALGHEVHVLAGDVTATPVRTTLDGGVHVHRFWADGPGMRAIRVLGGRYRLWWSRQRLQNAWSMYRGLRALQVRHPFDVVEMPECGGEGALLTRRVAVPSVVRLHSPSRLIMPTYDVRAGDIRLCSAIEQRGISGATALTSCSRFLAGAVRDEMGVHRPIDIVTNGIDVDWFDAIPAAVDVHARYGLPKRSLLMVFTGRMERRKGIHLFPEIARAILERHDVTFALAGADLFNYVADTLMPSLAGRALRGSLHWLGALPLDELRPLVRAADVFLLPSLWENCPYSCLEAMAAGRAIVASRQGGMPELIDDGVNGLLADTDSAASFIHQIERLIGDEPLRRRLGVAARQTIETAHRHTDVAAQAVAVYRRAIAGGRQR